jgi:uncharacterized protein YfkK (UPF0435 family)
MHKSRKVKRKAIVNKIACFRFSAFRLLACFVLCLLVFKLKNRLLTVGERENMTTNIKAILKKYNLINDNIYEDNLDNLTEKQTEKITDILVIYDENLSVKKQFDFLSACYELNALNNSNEYITYRLDDTLYLTAQKALNEFT